MPSTDALGSRTLRTYYKFKGRLPISFKGSEGEMDEVTLLALAEYLFQAYLLAQKGNLDLAEVLSIEINKLPIPLQNCCKYGCETTLPWFLWKLQGGFCQSCHERYNLQEMRKRNGA